MTYRVEFRPRRSGGCESSRLWRVRTGDYRVINSIEDDALLVLVINVRHGREADGR